MSSQKRVLVTGGSDLVASHCLLEALKRGLGVKTTVRSPRRVDEVRRMLRKGGATQQQIADIAFFPYNELFTQDDCEEVVLSCDFIIHTIPYRDWDIRHMQYEDAVSLAKDAVLQLLRAAKASNPRCKVVIINSFWAVKGTKPSLGKGQHFTEADWSIVQSGEDMSLQAKRRNQTVLAERAIWDWLSSEGHGVHVSVLNPVKVTGPVLSDTQAESMKIITEILSNRLSESPDYPLGVVDARDVADLAFLCLDNPTAAGERFISCADGDLTSIKDIVDILKRATSHEETNKAAHHIYGPWMMKIMRFSGIITAEMAEDLLISNKVSNQKARDLGWRPRSAEESILAAVQSLKEFGLLDSVGEERATFVTSETVREKT